MARVFISYRREDSAGHAGRIFDRLAARFGPENVFLDVGTIPPGADFVEVVGQAVGSVDVLVPVIGPRWHSITDREGHRRLDHPEDMVRTEVEAALARRIPVLPVLVGGASMPRSTELPEAIAGLARRNALGISDPSFDADVQRLIEGIEGILAAAGVAAAAPQVRGSPSPPERTALLPSDLIAESVTPSRRTVTALGIRLVSDPPIEARLDPEPMHDLSDRATEAITRLLESYGGRLQASVGSRLMGVFGLPHLHEDDLQRALGAAVGLTGAVAGITSSARAAWGIDVGLSVGVATGEVVGWDDRQTATWPPMIEAGAIADRASRGEVLLAGAAYRAARKLVDAEPVEGQPDLFRLLRIREAEPERRLQSPMVGRGAELAILGQAFERAARERSCHLFTLIGAAGVGKSRLVEEFLAGVRDEARVVVGRCLSYGEGITYWPIGEIVRSIAGVAESDTPEEARAKLAHIPGATGEFETVADRVAQAIGLSTGTATAEEISWAVRKLLEQVARRGTLIVHMEDLHWAEPTLLDLIEHVADWSRGASILLVCTARHELLDSRPNWSGGTLNASTVLLQPLEEADAELLLDNLLGDAAVPPPVRRRIFQAAEGNPLFVEEIFGMLVDEGMLVRHDGQWVTGDLGEIRIPPTISALLAARIDSLRPEEREVAERASVIGREFPTQAVMILVSESLRPRVPSELMSLVRRELVLPTSAAGGALDDDFLFRHILIRDAAYQAIPKAVRSDLHERFASWLEAVAGERVAEYGEIVGYHLEQSVRYRGELRAPTESDLAVARRAFERLAHAGHQAFARGDVSGARNLLTRAIALLANADPQRLALLPRLGAVLTESGDLEQARAVLEEAASAAQDEGTKWRAKVELAELQLYVEPKGWAERAMATADAARAALERIGDDGGLARTWRLVAEVHDMWGQQGPQIEALEKAAVHADRAGDAREAWISAVSQAHPILEGPTPVSEAVGLYEKILQREGARLVIPARILGRLAVLRAMEGRLGEARTLLGRARSLNQELGLTPWMMASLGYLTARVEMLAGNPGAAEEALRPPYEKLNELGEKPVASGLAAYLAHSLCAQARWDEALALSSVSEEASAPDDLISQVLWRSARGWALTGLGRLDEAERFAREAVRAAAETDMLVFHADALVILARTIEGTGRHDDAAEAAWEAVALYERKGDVASAKRARGVASGLKD